ncbi:beta-glucuronidase [Hydra vulgaris]|uniref:beta-glucuronidase n=1 Tax=Hydra vulgaris TaxID=6087 RepID=UPI0006416DF6|nr:beta-glucuronidase [Hydra vulgaris]
MIFFFSLVFLPSSFSLFPQESETREVKLLTGLWDFRMDNSSARNAGFHNEWYRKSLKETGKVIQMPVPASFNDLSEEATTRDFVGWVWYERNVFVPSRWDDEKNLRVVLRFESCHYLCVVWVNGEAVMHHQGGHLPFEAEVTSNLKFGEENRITVAANNTLTPFTLPPGSIEYMQNSSTRKYPPGYFVQVLQMDFFNYAGIHRPVKLYVTPTIFLLDVSVTTDIDDETGILNFKSSVAVVEDDDQKRDTEESVYMTYEIIDDAGNTKAVKKGNNLFNGSISLSKANLWWPIGMDEFPGYMYTLKISLLGAGNQSDIYRLPFGFRTVQTDNKNFYINKKPFYFKGFGMHEDSNIRGKGWDLSMIVKDLSLIKWMGGNSFRTSHYPYADETMDLADRLGLVVIDESPGVGIQRNNMGQESLKHHNEVMKELINRDKNHPSVVMWSVANEPQSQFSEADGYFKSVIDHVRDLDPTRPVTFVGNQMWLDDKAVKYVDVICYNSYYAWYHDAGHLNIISMQLENALYSWHNVTNKPVIMSEYGADAVAGIHRLPSAMFTEEYQVDTVRRYFPIFDKFRGKGLVGEMIWNLADFMTAQDLKRVDGNKKGVFTRDRQPKWVAHVLRERYLSLASSIESDPAT